MNFKNKSKRDLASNLNLTKVVHEDLLVHKFLINYPVCVIYSILTNICHILMQIDVLFFIKRFLHKFIIFIILTVTNLIIIVPGI